MTNTESQGAGEWRKQFDAHLGLYSVWRGNRMVATGMFGADADQLLADHAAARELPSLRETVGTQEKTIERLRALLGPKCSCDFPTWNMPEPINECGYHSNMRRRLLTLTSPEEVNQHEPSA